jgi:hypothetical protein
LEGDELRLERGGICRGQSLAEFRRHSDGPFLGTQKSPAPGMVWGLNE